MTRLNILQGIVKGIGHTDNNRSFHIAASVGSQSSEARYLLQLDDIKGELQKLQDAVEGVRKKLKSMNDTSKNTLRKQFAKIIRPDKEMGKIQALLTNIRSIQESTSWLNQTIPM